MRSKSETIKALAFEITHILAFLVAGNVERLDSLCQYNTDQGVVGEIFDEMFGQLGEQNLQLHEKS